MQSDIHAGGQVTLSTELRRRNDGYSNKRHGKDMSKKNNRPTFFSIQGGSTF
jgi:hypothetical protein